MKKYEIFSSTSTQEHYVMLGDRIVDTYLTLDRALKRLHELNKGIV